MQKVVIVGASLAGVHAAGALRERGYDGGIQLVSADESLPYDRPPLSKEALFSGIEEGKLLLHEEQWYTDRAVALRLGRKANQLDVRNRQIRLDDGSSLAYDGLVVATGSHARRVSSNSATVPVHVVRELADSQRLREGLLPGRHLVLIGGGFIGLEVASTARQLGLEVTVVEVAQVPLGRVLGDEVGGWFRDLHVRHGVRVECGAALESVEARGSGARLHLSDGRHIDGDVVVAGIGAAPAVEWLAGSGVRLANGVECGPDLSTSVPGIVAAGDVARWYNPIFDEEMRVEHWTNAVEQGRHAAATLLGEAEAFSSVPYFWTDEFEARMRFVGRADAADSLLIETMTDNKLVALYGRDGFIRGAVCVNAPRQLAKYRNAIRDRVAWEEILAGQTAVAPTH